MSHDRMMQAIGRIENALGRLEKVDPRRVSAPAGDPELVARHEKLKAEARATVAEIDRLLAEVRG
jgi:hypothetical protein